MIEMEETKQLIQEIVEAKRSIISIDANDIKDTFQGDSPIYGFTVSVSPALDFRTEVLFDEIREKAEQFKPFNKVLLFFFIYAPSLGTDHPIRGAITRLYELLFIIMNFNIAINC